MRNPCFMGQEITGLPKSRKAVPLLPHLVDREVQLPVLRTHLWPAAGFLLAIELKLKEPIRGVPAMLFVGAAVAVDVAEDVLSLLLVIVALVARERRRKPKLERKRWERLDMKRLE